jgi:hypothetical protein
LQVLEAFCGGNRLDLIEQCRCAFYEKLPENNEQNQHRENENAEDRENPKQAFRSRVVWRFIFHKFTG